jgi:hypothetical protein
VAVWSGALVGAAEVDPDLSIGAIADDDGAVAEWEGAPNAP